MAPRGSSERERRARASSVREVCRERSIKIILVLVGCVILARVFKQTGDPPSVSEAAGSKVDGGRSPEVTWKVSKRGGKDTDLRPGLKGGKPQGARRLSGKGQEPAGGSWGGQPYGPLAGEEEFGLDEARDTAELGLENVGEGGGRGTETGEGEREEWGVLGGGVREKKETVELPALKKEEAEVKVPEQKGVVETGVEGMGKGKGRGRGRGRGKWRGTRREKKKEPRTTKKEKKPGLAKPAVTGVVGGAADEDSTPNEVYVGKVARQPGHVLPLGVDLSTKRLEKVLLHNIYVYQNVSRAHPCNEILQCPKFTKCRHARSVAVGICRNLDLENGRTWGMQPLNLPPAEVKRRGQTMAPFMGNVYMIENVYVDIWGKVFNRTHLFIGGGCFSFSTDSFFPATTNVTYFKVLANLVTWSAQNFYHTITETLPDMLVLEEVIKAHPDIPIAIKNYAERGPFGRLAPWLGFNLSNLNLYYLVDHEKTKPVNNLFFAEKLLVPGHQFCGKPSGAVIQKLRKKFGIRSIHSGNEVKDLQERASKLGSLNVVVGRRPYGLHRSIVGQDDLQRRLEDLYGANRVKSFWGNESVKETINLFNQAALYIGPHGAGMTNVIFMLSGAAVIEIMPKDYANPCYHYLCDRCNLDYYRLHAKGNWSTTLEVQFESVTDLATKILTPYKQL